MPNPTFTPNTPGQASYAVADTKDLFADLWLKELEDEGAQFTLICPAAAITVTLTRGGQTISLDTATSQTYSGIANRTVTTQVSQAGGIATLLVGVTSPVAAADEYWKLRISHNAPQSVTLNAPIGSNVQIIRLLADPKVTIINPAPPATFFEKAANVTLSGTVQYTLVVSAAPPAGLPALASLRAAWSQSAGTAAAAPAGTWVSTASPAPLTVPDKFNAPGVYGEIPLTYKLTAYYDLDANAAFDAGEPANFAEVTVTIKPRNQHMLLVLDRSGSMLGKLTGSTMTRWELARRAAHVWADLFITFRKDVAQDKVGVMIFEAQTCGWKGATASPLQILLPASQIPGDLSAIDVDPLSLGGPGACTPIGDALYEAMKQLNAIPNSSADDRYIIVLMTDGYENSGKLVVEDDTPKPAGATDTFANRRGDYPKVNGHLSMYTLGVGPTVQESMLNDLPLPAGSSTVPGFYRLVKAPEDLNGAFAEMLGHAIDAQPLYTLASPCLGVADPNARYFYVNAQENRLAVVLHWDNSADDIILSYRTKTCNIPNPDPFTIIAGGGIAPDAAKVTVKKRGNHGIISVKLPALYPEAVPETEWKIEYVPAGAASPQPIDLKKLLIMVDLCVKAEISFDQPRYRTGDPIVITARLRAGAQPITKAKVTVELARPGESLGTFLATDSRGYQPPKPVFPDPPAPKSAMLQTLLRQKDWRDLPILKPPAIFADGTSELFDDGLHQDGLKGDGDFANVFTNTDKEGTYTWRFFVEGQLADGSYFNRLLTVSKWVGIKVDVSASDLMVRNLAATGGFQAVHVQLIPRDKKGEYLGPFRASDITYKTTAGEFLGPDELKGLSDGEIFIGPDGKATVTHYDGRYSRVLRYREGEIPVVTVIVQDQVFPPIPVAKGCLGLVYNLISRLLKWLLELILRRK